MSNLIEIEGVDVAYAGQALVLRAATACFDAGQTHAVTGPSGSGKSTLLYVAGLMLRPSTGRVVIDGVDYAQSSDRVRSHARAEMIGFVFQDALLEPSMTVWQNILEGVPLQHPSRQFHIAARDHLERLGLDNLTHRPASKLSGGQAQRVALVRAILKNPRILLADEPTGNLDDATAAIVLDELFHFGTRRGHTTLIVTHDQRIANRTDTRLELTSVATGT